MKDWHLYGPALGQTDHPATPPEWEIFDLVKDTDEKNNIYNQIDYINIRNQLINRLFEFQDKYDDRDSNIRNVKYN
jgi:hypothetical protein